MVKTIPKKKKCKKAKWLSEEALQIAEKREVKGKGEKERCTHLNAEFQRTARRNNKAFLSDQCKEREALVSITTNKASGGDRISAELFQILKDDAVKCCTEYASKFGKLSSGYRTRKGQFSFQSQRKALPRNV